MSGTECITCKINIIWYKFLTRENIYKVTEFVSYSSNFPNISTSYSYIANVAALLIVYLSIFSQSYSSIFSLVKNLHCTVCVYVCTKMYLILINIVHIHVEVHWGWLTLRYIIISPLFHIQAVPENSNADTDD